jgi:prephenate dehydratase
MTIAFQGELGAFSEEAVYAVFETAELVPCAGFEDVFAAVEGGTADRAVVPIENSVFGSVHINYDHLRQHDVQIVGEVNLRIRHHLMASEATSLDRVRRVQSHPQALGQCRRFLRQHLPEAETQPMYDTAGAAKHVAEAGVPDTAAIASEAAAARYGLTVLAAEIEDDPKNFTRFLVLARADAEVDPPVEALMKTSIVFALRENVPGALFKSLAVFALRDLDLFKIESRPRVGHPGRYLFYLDVQGRATDEPVERALDHLGEITAELKVLGSYPEGMTVTTRA